MKRIDQAFFFNGCGAPLSSRRLPPCWVLRENPEFSPIFWVFWQRFEFFPLCSLNKSCPNFEFWAKNGLEFFRIGQKLRFFHRWVFAKMLKKKSCHMRKLWLTRKAEVAKLDRRFYESSWPKVSANIQNKFPSWSLSGKSVCTWNRKRYRLVNYLSFEEPMW